MKHVNSRVAAGGSVVGITGILTNFNAYQRWAKTAHEHAQYVAATFHMVDMLSEYSEHTKRKDFQPAKVQKSVAKVCEAIKGFTDPYAVEDKEKLYCISSSAAASSRLKQMF